MRIDERGCSTLEGASPGPGPVASFTMDVGTLNELFFGRLSAKEAIAAGQVTIRGDAGALGRFWGVFPRVMAQPAGAVVWGHPSAG